MSTIITPIIMPFASGRASGTLPNVIPAIAPNSPDDDVANQTTGFPLLQATSLGSGGVPVQEGEMNGVLNFYTNLLFQMGQGYQFTFDETLSNAISGYPQGAILWCASNSTFQISLKNNNNNNFVTNPSFVNDGVNWQNLSNAGEFPDITDNVATGSVTIGGKVVNGLQQLKTFDNSGRKAGLSVGVDNQNCKIIMYVSEPDSREANVGFAMGSNFVPEFFTSDTANHFPYSIVRNKDFSSSLSNDAGYIKLPSGVDPNLHIQTKVIIQFGGTIFNDIPQGQTIYYPIRFPNNVIAVVLTESGLSSENEFSGVYRIVSKAPDHFIIGADIWSQHYPTTWGINWIAIGF